MRIKTNVAKAKAALAVVGKAIGGNSVTKATQNVLITIADGSLTTAKLMCYDDVKHINISTTLEIEADVAGEVIIDCKTLSNFLGKLPDGEIVMDFSDNQVLLKSGKSKVTMATKDVNSFPKPHPANTSSEILLNATELNAMVNGVAFAAATQDHNKMMTGVNVVKKGNKLSLVALDGHRIAMNSIVIPDNNDIDIIVEAALLKIACSILSGEISLKIGKSNLVLSDDKTIVTMQLIEGKYFNISSFEKAESDKHIRLNKEMLKSSLDRTTLFVSAADRKPVNLSVKDNVLTLSVVTALGTTEETLDVSQEGEDISISANPFLLLDALKNIKDEEVVLDMSTPKSPIIMKGDNYMHLVLPVMVSR
jgi:DNA polymerase-3 subunit beta